MKYKPIIIVNGDPNSIFIEIFFKALKFKKFKSPIILISSIKLLKFYMKKFNIKKKIKIIDINYQSYNNLNNNVINLININLKNLRDINNASNIFINNSFKVGLELIKKNISKKLINGPISKKKFLNKKYPGVTEYIAYKTKTKKFAMLIYNEKLSVCPLTTHLPIKKVVQKITRKNILEKVYLINDFYLKYKKIKPRIAILGLNPHCESNDKFNEDDNIIRPTVKYLSKLKYHISGPYPADTIFLKKNRGKFDVILGMYHDQVLTPMKTLFEYDAINITLGLPFVRISPDHGPNIKMVGKNISNPLSLIKSINFLDKI